MGRLVFKENMKFMGCTGPIVLVSDDEAEKAQELLTGAGFIS